IWRKKLMDSIGGNLGYYHILRSRFALSSQMAVRCLARVAGTYKRDPGLCPTFKSHAAMPYDQRIMRFHGLDQVSLLTLAGRVCVAFLVGTYHRERFDAHAPGNVIWCCGMRSSGSCSSSSR